MFGDQLMNGLTLGFIYALIALGYTMVYGIVRLINFAHGDIIMLGAYAGYFVMNAFGTSSPGLLLVAMLVSMVACAVFGVLLERICYRPLRNAPRINLLIVAIGASFFIENFGRILFTPNYRQYPVIGDWAGLTSFYEAVALPEWLRLSPVNLIVIGISVSMMVILAVIVKFTKTGKAMRAVSTDFKAASLMGINVNRIISITFAIGSALAAVAGILYSSKYPSIYPYMGIMPGLKAFVAAVLGGIGSIPGAMLGGLLLGISETLAKGYISSKMSDAIVFGILIIILLVKPTGILGKTLKEKV